ncbi:MAG: helix-turn-helix domain-containing protein [Alicyclobacillus macrosporangiidus]|nr:helix-turn-helix domain-containing protein [Alicyclobacillus macrosporangiidus]
MTLKLLKMSEVANMLNISVDRAYELARQGLMPVVRLGRQIRVEESDLINWVKSGGSAFPGGWRKDPTHQVIQ